MGALDGRSAREELWRRYDAGDLDASSLEARLRAVDRAADEDALRRALDAPITTADPTRRALLLGGIAVALIAAIALPLVLLGGESGGDDTVGTATTGGIAPPITPAQPVPAPVDCPEVEDAMVAVDAAASDEPPANPSLLSDPPAVPEGYRVDDDEEIVPGTDPDIAMQVSAGSPLPVAIRARTLRGELDVSMRAFQYASVEDADAAGQSVVAQGACLYGAEQFGVPDRPDLVGSVATDAPIPPTAFVGFRIGDRRFTVGVVAPSDSDADLELAKALAGTIAGLERDAANTAPGLGEPPVGTVVPAPPTTVILG